MATGLEHGVLLFARIAAGSVFGLVAHGVGGYLFPVETIEPGYPFLDLDRDPVLDPLIALVGTGLFVTSKPLLILATLFDRDGIDVSPVTLTIAVGAVGLALVRLWIFKLL